MLYRGTKILFSKNLVCLFAFCLLTGQVSAQGNDKIEWSITPYLWASDTKVDLTYRETELGGGEISFKELLDALDTAGMIHVEGGRGRWSMFGDLTYLKLSKTNERRLLTVDTQNKQTFIDTAVAYWPGGFGSSFNIIFGLRYTGFNSRFRFGQGETVLDERSTSANYYDALFGLRYRFDFAERWSLLTRGDCSFGDSKGICLVRANLAFSVGKRQQNRIMLGYQYKQAEYKDGDLATDFTYHGPTAGFNFRF